MNLIFKSILTSRPGKLGNQLWAGLLPLVRNQGVCGTRLTFYAARHNQGGLAL